jgi:predicted nuclease of restriction endonuclease-like (RecB) superfamily
MPSKEKTSKVATHSEVSVSDLLVQLRELIGQARQQALRAVDVVQVRTSWQLGRHIVEFEQDGRTRAAYGAGLLAQLATQLTAEFGKGFDASNLYKMTRFYRQFPNLDAVSLNLSWTHYRLLMRLDDPLARDWYVKEAAGQNWSTRQLERQMGTLYYERLLASKDRQAVLGEAQVNLAGLNESPREFVRDPVMLEFLGLAGSGRLLESKLEDALIGNLQAFLLELGKGFAFVARQQRISTESKDFYVDLVFYNHLLKCFVLFDLKTRELTHENIGQMDMYVRLYDDQRRGADDNPTVGIILCASKDETVVRYSVLHGNEQLFASKYKLILPSELELRAELDREIEGFRQQQLLQNEADSRKKAAPKPRKPARSPGPRKSAK